MVRPMIAAAVQETSTDPHLTLAPAFNGWLLALGMLAAGATIIYLYRAQRKIASGWLVAALTVIRVALIVLLFVMLMRPLRQWTTTRESGGTLWLVLDQSLSMKQADPQSLTAERLRWAASLGYLPASLHACALDEIGAEIAAMREDSASLEASGMAPTSDQDVSKELDTFVKMVREWSDRLGTLAAQLEADPSPDHNAVADIAHDLKLTSGVVIEGVARAKNRGRREQAVNEIPWTRMRQTSDDAMARLKPLADHANTDFLSRHGADPVVAAALAKVASLRRCDLAKAMLTGSAQRGRPAVQALLEKQNTHLLAFAGTQQVVPAGENDDLANAIKMSLEPAGTSTDVAGALKFVMQQVDEGEPASVLLISDGRQNTGGDIVDPARRLAARGIRVFTLLIGSRELAVDAAVEQIDAPDWIYKDDTSQLSALIRLDGLKGKGVKVELRRNGTVVDESKSVTATHDHETQRVVFSDRPPAGGVFEYEVRVQELPEEAVKQNNRMTARVAVKEEKLHVLVIEDQPRWEYRYLTNYLLRDKRVQLQTVLLQPAHVAGVDRPTTIKASALNKDSVDAQVLPQTQSDWSGFDMIVLGDVAPEQLPAAAQKMIGEAVKNRGSTLAIIAGQQNMPARYAGTPLAELLPVETTHGWNSSLLQDHLIKGFRLSLAPEGTASTLSQFGLDSESNGKLWADLPAWYWHSEQTQARSSASVLWEIAGMGKGPQTEPGGAGIPTLSDARQRALLATSSLGLGRVMYLASDSTWRLRQVAGENLHERFWGQVVRWVAGTDLPAGGTFVRFGTSKPRYTVGDSVVVSARVLKEDLTPLAGQKIQVIAKVRGAGGADGRVVAEGQMVDAPETPGFYRATLTSLPAGPLEISLAGAEIERLLASDSSAVQKSLAVDIQASTDVEQQNINTDRAAMAGIARAGGGLFLDGPFADVLTEHMPPLSKSVTLTHQAGLFADPNDPGTRRWHWMFMGIFTALITGEWLLRKTGGLV